MQSKMAVKIGIDLAMTAALLLLMAYSLIGEAAHEWIGIAMLVLFLTHHILNCSWHRNLLKGRYTPLRIWQTVLVAAVLLSMAGSMVSGIVLSRHALAFLPISGGQSWARTLHLLCAYWGLVVMSLHLGFHWSMMMGFAKKAFPASSKARAWLLRLLAVGTAGYGAFAFWKRQIGSYLFLQSEFVFFNFEEPLIFFFLDYLAVMALFVCIGHYIAQLLRQKNRKGKA